MSDHRVGLVVAGGGARGAYEAGALSALLPRLAPATLPAVLVGTSAGALNVVALTALLELGPRRAAAGLVELWGTLRLADVFSPGGSIAGSAQYAAQLVGMPRRLTSLLDTSGQRHTLERLVDWERFHACIASGPVDAVALATTSAATGGTVIFVERKPSVPLPDFDAVRNIAYVDTELTIDHVLASAAVPILFRPVWVPQPAEYAGWYLDGGVRLNTPLEPAVDLGCDRIVVVATQPGAWPDGTPVRRRRRPREPDVFAVGSLLLQAALSDRMVEDLKTLGTINELIGRDQSPYRHIDYLFAGPTPAAADALSDLANAVFRQHYGALRGLRNPAVWMLNRLIGGSAGDHGDLLSFLFFDAAFTTRAAMLGHRHARAQLGSGPLPWRSSLREVRPLAG